MPLRGQVLRDDLESHRPGALHEHDIARPQHLGQPLGRLGGSRHPVSAVGARELADGDHMLDAKLPQEVTHLGVVGAGVRAELGHLAEDGNAPPARPRAR